MGKRPGWIVGIPTSAYTVHVTNQNENTIQVINGKSRKV